MGATQSQENEENQPQIMQQKPEEKASESEIKPKEQAKAMEVKLPFNYESILREADTSVDRSSVAKLYDQLCNGVFLNHKKRKYWVEKKSNNNCFFLFARDLSITWADDDRFWFWTSIHETSDVHVDVGELLNVCWLEIHARVDTTILSPNIQYEVAFVILLKDPAYGWDVPVNLRLTLPNGTKQEHKENLASKLRGQWIEVPVGEFTSSPENAGEIEISMYEYDGGKWKRGLVIKGVTIRPKIKDT